MWPHFLSYFHCLSLFLIFALTLIRKLSPSPFSLSLTFTLAFFLISRFEVDWKQRRNYIEIHFKWVKLIPIAEKVLQVLSASLPFLLLLATTLLHFYIIIMHQNQFIHYLSKKCFYLLLYVFIELVNMMVNSYEIVIVIHEMRVASLFYLSTHYLKK